MKHTTPLHAKHAPSAPFRALRNLAHLFEQTRGVEFNLSRRERTWITRTSILMIAVSLAAAIV